MGHAGHPGAYPGKMKHKKMKARWAAAGLGGSKGCCICRRCKLVACWQDAAAHCCTHLPPASRRPLLRSTRAWAAGAGTSSSAAASSSGPGLASRASAASAGAGASGSEVMQRRPSEAAGRWRQHSTSGCATPQLAGRPPVFAFFGSLFLPYSQTYLHQRPQFVCLQLCNHSTAWMSGSWAAAGAAGTWGASSSADWLWPGHLCSCLAFFPPGCLWFS